MVVRWRCGGGAAAVRRRCGGGAVAVRRRCGGGAAAVRGGAVMTERRWFVPVGGRRREPEAHLQRPGDGAEVSRPHRRRSPAARSQEVGVGGVGVGCQPLPPFLPLPPVAPYPPPPAAPFFPSSSPPILSLPPLPHSSLHYSYRPSLPYPSPLPLPPPAPPPTIPSPPLSLPSPSPLPSLSPLRSQQSPPFLLPSPPGSRVRYAIASAEMGPRRRHFPTGRTSVYWQPVCVRIY